MDIIADEIRFENESATSAPPNGNKKNKQNSNNNNNGSGGYPRKIAGKLNVGPMDGHEEAENEDADAGSADGDGRTPDGSIMQIPGQGERGESRQNRKSSEVEKT